MRGNFLYFYLKFQPFLFLAYLSIWWLGHELAVSYLDGKRLPKMRVALMGLVPLAAFSIVGLMSYAQGERVTFSTSHMLEIRQYAVAYGMFLIMLALGWDRLEKLGKWRFASGHLSSISYGIYALHFLVIIFVETYIVDGWLGVLLCLPIVWGVAWIAENKLQPIANRLWPSQRKAS